MAHAKAYGKRYGMCRRLCSSITNQGLAMQQMVVEVYCRYERADVPGGAEHLVARLRTGFGVRLVRPRFPRPWQRLFHVKHQEIG